MVTSGLHSREKTDRHAASRRVLGFCVLLLALTSLVFSAVPARAEIVLRDAIGREVRLEAPARRIVTNESLLLYSLALLDPDPVAIIVGWAAPRRIDSGIYDAFRRRFPAIDVIPEVGSVVPANVSLEAILSTAPDLFVVSLWDPGWDMIAEQLGIMGVPVIFLDSPDRAGHGPAEATAFSIGLLGNAIGRTDEARAFGDFVTSRYRVVADRLATVTARPTVLIDVHAGTLCCYTPGSGNRMTQYLELAGGHSIGADAASGYDGQLGPEFVLQANPDVYIGTGSPHLSMQGGLVIGGGIAADTAQKSLRDVTSRNLLGSLSAVQNGRAFGISHQLTISALNVLAFECFAKWVHPEALAEVDPEKTLAEINERFLAIKLEGTFWTGLGGAASAP